MLSNSNRSLKMKLRTANKLVSRLTKILRKLRTNNQGLRRRNKILRKAMVQREPSLSPARTATERRVRIFPVPEVAQTPMAEILRQLRQEKLASQVNPAGSHNPSNLRLVNPAAAPTVS